MDRNLFIGEGFEGPGLNLAHINVLVGPRSGPAGQAFATALATPSAGHAPFVMIAQPGVPAKPLTLYLNKAPIQGDFHGNATWGASQAGIAKAVAESLETARCRPKRRTTGSSCRRTGSIRRPTISTRSSKTITAPARTPSSCHGRPAAQGSRLQGRARRLQPVLHAEAGLRSPCMEYVRLGQSGLKVSCLCLGTMNIGTPQWKPWIFDEAQSEPIVRHALEAGVNFIDLADFYSTGVGEEVVGRILKRLARREDIVVTTKVGYDMASTPNAGGHSRKHVMDGIDASLTRLGMDHVDLYMLHFFDVNTPVEETMHALDDIVRAGKARYAILAYR